MKGRHVTDACPPDGELERLLAGATDAAEGQALQAHVAERVEHVESRERAVRGHEVGNDFRVERGRGTREPRGLLVMKLVHRVAAS